MIRPELGALGSWSLGVWVEGVGFSFEGRGLQGLTVAVHFAPRSYLSGMLSQPDNGCIPLRSTHLEYCS